MILAVTDQPRVALVTGSSHGLGMVIAERLSRDGLAVGVNDRGGDGRADDVAEAIRSAGGTADAFAADVTDEAQVTRLVAEVMQKLGPIDVLVLNATGPQPERELLDVSWADHLAELNFFVKSPVLLGRAIVPSMRTRRFGRIIHIDSEVADRPPPGRSAYATAKSAQIGLMRGWVRELGPFGITVNAVAPAFIPVERHDAVPPRRARRTWRRCRWAAWGHRRTSLMSSAFWRRMAPASSPDSASSSTAVAAS